MRAAVVLSLLAAAACTTTSVVGPQQLERLDGFGTQASNAREPELETLSGERVAVGRNARVFLELPSERIGGQFDVIRVQDGVLQGTLRNGGVVEAPLEEVSSASIEQTDTPAIVAGIGGILLAGLIAALLLSRLGTSTTVEGRPLRVRGRVVKADVVDSEGWTGAGPGPDTRGLSLPARVALAAGWTEIARSEHASVPAFSRLALTLMSFGAPAHLVEAAHRAALEEIEHARLAFALAGAYADTAAAPGALVELRHAPAVTAMSLAVLAQESLIDGCLNEGIGAEVARESLACAGDPAARAALEIIARDESSHAELAWQIVEWCCAEGGADVKRTLRKAIHAPCPFAAPSPLPEHLQRELGAHGWLGIASWQEVADRTHLAVASRLASLLACPV
jgi:hypothetical protein